MSDSTFSSRDLAALFDAFNRHNIDGVMKYFAPKCVFNAVAGLDICGLRIEGATAIAAAFAGVWTTSADVRWHHNSHFVHGDRAESEWTFWATNPDGRRVEAEGCDLFTLRDGKIVRK